MVSGNKHAAFTFDNSVEKVEEVHEYVPEVTHDAVYDHRTSVEDERKEAPGDCPIARSLR